MLNDESTYKLHTYRRYIDSAFLPAQRDIIYNDFCRRVEDCTPLDSLLSEYKSLSENITYAVSGNTPTTNLLMRRESVKLIILYTKASHNEGGDEDAEV